LAQAALVLVRSMAWTGAMQNTTSRTEVPKRSSRRWLLPLVLAGVLGCVALVFQRKPQHDPPTPTLTGRALSLDNMNEKLLDMKYAVRGEVPERAEEIALELEAAAASGAASPYNFSKLLRCNIGNPQAVGQPPITFYRQVLSLVDSPSLLKRSKRRWSGFPRDVVDRATELAEAAGSTGAYTHSQGIPLVRRHVCDFIEARDGGPPCNPDNVFLLNGASAGIQSVLTALIAGPSDAVMVPIPQYPIYSALITLLGGKLVKYYMDETRGWGLSIPELQQSITAARADGLNPRALVMINPGNPTGQVFSQEDLEALVRFCQEQRLLLLADEVYQANVYAPDREFISTRSVVASIAAGDDTQSGVELVSFHSTSKGLVGECGRRGGYMEFMNIDPQVQAELYKLQSSQLCSNVDGQVMTDLMVRPPVEGEPSYELFKKESEAIFASLQRKAQVVVQKLNEVDGVSCNSAEGAMYAFVKIDLPAKAVEAAAAKGMAPDLMYCLSLLEATGIVTVPGSGFGQRSGEHHFRITFLPKEEDLYRALDAFKVHHESFVARYA